ncbi:MAG: AMP-binding protein [Archangiaceae bacterium]|nr:AMP-binding protein [Archangiaceae bacterium]
MLDWLFTRFEAAGDAPALIHLDQPSTYRWLLERTRHWSAEFQRLGIEGRSVALEADYSPIAIAVVLALIERGNVVVPLTSTVESRKPEFRAIAEVSARIIIGADEQPRCEVDPAPAPKNELLTRLLATGHPGLVLFSSGSTGAPKAALHDFIPLLEKFKVQRHTLRTITFLLLDHIGGINTLLYVLSNTGTIVTLADRNPESVCAAIARHRVELLPTSPTFLNLLLMSDAASRFDLSSLKQVTYGTEPMPQSTLSRIHAALPNVKLLQTYGLSELGILRSKSKSDDSLFVKIGGEGFETKVVDGTLRIRAKSSMLGYLNAKSPFDAEGWFDTGDEVIVDGEYLRILGRRSELINVGGEKVYPAEVESVLLELPDVVDASVRGAPNPITGMMVVARLTFATQVDEAEVRRRVRDFCKTRLASFKVPAKIECVHEPLHSARFKKIRRVDV